MMATSTSSVSGSRARSPLAHGSSANRANAPVISMYWAMPSARKRRARSSAYRRRSASTSRAWPTVSVTDSSSSPWPRLYNHGVVFRPLLPVHRSEERSPDQPLGRGQRRVVVLGRQRRPRLDQAVNQRVDRLDNAVPITGALAAAESVVDDAVDDFAECPEPRIVRLVGVNGDRTFRPDHPLERREVGVLAHQPARLVEDRFYSRDGVAGTGGRLAQPRDRDVGPRRHRGLHQLGLVREVVVQARTGHAGGAGDLADRRAGVSRGGHAPHGGDDDPLAGFLAAGTNRASELRPCHRATSTGRILSVGRRPDTSNIIGRSILLDGSTRRCAVRDQRPGGG